LLAAVPKKLLPGLFLLFLSACAVGGAVVASGRAPATEEPVVVEPPAYSFLDVTAAEGILLQPRRSWGSTWMDHDLDGSPDLLVNRHFLAPVYFEHQVQGYSEAEWQDVLRVPDFDRHACLWGDPNQDALPDLLCLQGAERGRGTGPNQLIVQKPGGGFVRERGALGLAYAPGRSRTGNWVDFDRDGDLDFFDGTAYREGYPNRMFRNRGGRFKRALVGLGDELQSEVSAWADWDQDRDLDLLLTRKDRRAVAYENRRGKFRRIRLPRVTTDDWLGATFGDLNGDEWPDLHLINAGRSLILRNRRGRFEPVHRMRTYQGRTGVWFDVDNDTDQDLFIVRGAPGNGDDPDAVDRPDLLLIQNDGRFKQQTVEESGADAGNGDSVAVSDHDRDGSLDLFITNGYKRTAGPFVLLENRSTIQNWAAVRLNGGRGDPFGMWADLKVSTPQGTYRRHLTDGLVFRSQSEVGHTHLGLGTAEHARVEVRWFRGGRDCVQLQAGQTVDLRKGSSPCN
jgi:hypothetical protein